MGYPCPASPEDRVEKAAEAKSPAPTPQFPPRGPKDQRLEDPIPLPDPILQQPARPVCYTPPIYMPTVAPLSAPVVRGVRYFLAHTPGMVRHGSNPSRDILGDPGFGASPGFPPSFLPCGRGLRAQPRLPGRHLSRRPDAIPTAVVRDPTERRPVGAPMARSCPRRSFMGF